MRIWKREIPCTGAEKIVRVFLVWPKMLMVPAYPGNAHLELRWLERAYIHRRYQQDRHWKDIRWADKEEYEEQERGKSK